MIGMLIPLASAEIGVELSYNDDGPFLQFFTQLPQVLGDYLIGAFADVYDFNRGLGMSEIFLTGVDNADLIREVGYLMSLRNEMLRSQTLFFPGYQYPIYCDVVPENVVNDVHGFLAVGTKVGWYKNYSDGSEFMIPNDPKCSF